MTEEKTEAPDTSQAEIKEQKIFYLTVFILPGDGSPRILPVSYPITRDDYHSIKKQLAMRPVPDDIVYHSKETGEPEVLHRKGERIFSITLDKVETKTDSGLILVPGREDGKKILQ